MLKEGRITGVPCITSRLDWNLYTDPLTYRSIFIYRYFEKPNNQRSLSEYFNSFVKGPSWFNIWYNPVVFILNA